MAYCCSQCNFTSNFESPLLMHHQLHHEGPRGEERKVNEETKEKSATIPRLASFGRSSPIAKESRMFKFPSRAASATKLFDKLKSKICKSKTLFMHQEESPSFPRKVNTEFFVPSECTSKALKDDSILLSLPPDSNRESYGCHLCSFVADRITVLDRHLLNDHRIGLDNLLKLVLDKTKEGLTNQQDHDAAKPYYKAENEIIEEGDFIIQTVTPQIKILKHTATNTENHEREEVSFKEITEQIEEFMQKPLEKYNPEELYEKMKVLDRCMGRFVQSNESLKKVLKESKSGRSIFGQRFSSFGLGDRDSRRNMSRAHSEKMERKRNCSTRSKLTSESYLF